MFNFFFKSQVYNIYATADVSPYSYCCQKNNPTGAVKFYCTLLYYGRKDWRKSDHKKSDFVCRLLFPRCWSEHALARSTYACPCPAESSLQEKLVSTHRLDAIIDVHNKYKCPVCLPVCLSVCLSVSADLSISLSLSQLTSLSLSLSQLTSLSLSLSLSLS